MRRFDTTYLVQVAGGKGWVAIQAYSTREEADRAAASIEDLCGDDPWVARVVAHTIERDEVDVRPLDLALAEGA